MLPFGSFFSLFWTVFLFFICIFIPHLLPCSCKQMTRSTHCTQILWGIWKPVILFSVFVGKGTAACVFSTAGGSDLRVSLPELCVHFFQNPQVSWESFTICKNSHPIKTLEPWSLTSSLLIILEFSVPSWLLAHSFALISPLSLFPRANQPSQTPPSHNNLFSYFSFHSAVQQTSCTLFIIIILVGLFFPPVLKMCVLSIFSLASCAAEYIKSSFLCYCCKFPSETLASPPALSSPLAFYWEMSHA